MEAEKSVCIIASFYWRLFIPGAFDRWELIQAQELHSKLRIKQNLQQLNSDISDITTWLEKTEAELETLKLAKPPSGMQEMELRVKKLKVSEGVEGKRTSERMCTSDPLPAASGAARTRCVVSSLSHFISVTSKDTGEDLYFHSEEHLQMIPKPRAVLGSCGSHLTAEGSLDSCGTTPAAMDRQPKDTLPNCMQARRRVAC